MSRAVFLFAGPGGACLGAKAVGITGPGIEFDTVVCRTRRAAGMETVEGSVTDYGPADFPDETGLWGSPPCQLFSTAGKGAARKLMPEILEAIAAMGRGEKPDTSGWPDGAMLVLEPLRWAIEAINLRRPYEWIALEQVPPVLPVWEAMADVLRHGYGVATGNLQAEMYGVPQTRKRAILIARLDGPVSLPTPTHSRYYPRDPQRLDPGVMPWISMATALGWGMNVRPSMTVTGGGASTGGAEPFGTGARTGMHREMSAGRFVYRSSTQRNSAMRSSGQAAPTIAFGHDSSSAGWLFAGRTAVDTAGQIPRDPAKPAHTITGKGTATWVGSDPTRGTCDAGGFCAGPRGGPCYDDGIRSEAERATMAAEAAAWPRVRPATTVSGSQYGAETVRVSVQEAAILQSFPADYPWTGDPENPNSRTSQYQMVGNAVPPLLAEAILRAARRSALESVT